MISPADSKNTAVFQASSIRAMSPMGREIAAMLKDAGYIEIIEQPAQERS
jgi:hypothetical protein